MENNELDINLSAEVHDSIGRLTDMGFDMTSVIQMYIASGRNEEAAVNLLLNDF